jgi:hypothetical protein
MDLSQFFAEVKRRNIRRLAVAYVTAGLLLIELAAILLAIFEAAAWGMKLLVGAVATGKGNVPVRRLLVRRDMTCALAFGQLKRPIVFI